MYQIQKKRTKESGCRKSCIKKGKGEKYEEKIISRDAGTCTVFYKYAPSDHICGRIYFRNSDVVSEEETPKIFTNEEQETAGETDEELSVFSSEEVPEFNDTPDEAMAAAENEGIDLANVSGGIYTISSAGNYTFTCSSASTTNIIVVDGKNILAEEKINIYLNNVNINTTAGPALRINKKCEGYSHYLFNRHK